MSAQTGSTRRLILEAAAACIEKYGIDQLTTRKIAQEAGTNIASINYYFHTKDDLVEETLSMTINHMLEDVFATIDDVQKPLEAALEEVFFYLIEGSLRFPGITTAHLYGAIVDKEYGSPSARAMRRLFERLAGRVQEAFPETAPDLIRFLLSQVLSAIMFTMLAPNFFPVDKAFQPRDQHRCRALAGSYTRALIATLKASPHASTPGPRRKGRTGRPGGAARSEAPSRAGSD
jgi:AcrR family transcriptional regulator